MPGGRVLVDSSRLLYRLRVPANVPAKGHNNEKHRDEFQQ